MPINFLAKKGECRTHLLTNEHAENVTVLACINALGQTILLMVIFKGMWKRDTQTIILRVLLLKYLLKAAWLERYSFGGCKFLQNLSQQELTNHCWYIMSLRHIYRWRSWKVECAFVPTVYHQIQRINCSPYWSTKLLGNSQCSLPNPREEKKFGLVFNKVWQQWHPK